MFNLIKKDIMTTIISNKKAYLEYLFILIFMYTILNPLSYFSVNIIISYLILINSFKNDNENEAGNFILSMGVSKENIVYSKYLLSFILIIVTSILNSVITWVLGGILYRGPVLNDILISNIIYLFIISIILPIIFKFEYKKTKNYIWIISLMLGFILFILLTLISDKIHNDINGSIVYYEFSGPFKSIFEYITYELNIKYINLYTLAFIASLLFVLSMYISIRIVKGKRIIDFKKFFITALILVVIFEGYIFINNNIYENIVHIDDYDIENFVDIEMELDGYKDTAEGTLIKIKISNNSRYICILDDITLNFGKDIEYEDGSLSFAPIISLDYYEQDLKSNNLMKDGIDPFKDEYISFLKPKGLKFEESSFDFNNVNIDYKAKFIVNIPIINILMTISSTGGSYNIEYINSYTE
ncbi:ABC-2 transporter permease [Romboutsia sp. 1001713B170207_170306_H8]|uniref:ABC-2 transporter permease n=2 Tax=unclassified Romboutsia TaxID=2626894 RepID=UPI00189B8BE4|nr:ABC-2 transporter permease [Romboutsia sp. 1001713B170207_170306_H8]